jgi:hypothetical protein
VYFEDVVNEYCTSKISTLSNRHKATIFNYLINKNIFGNHFASGDEKAFINDIEREIRKNKDWIKFTLATSLSSKDLIGKKDYPKPEHIMLALYKLGLDSKADRKLSSGLNEPFKTTLKRILDLRNAIAHDGIPSEWNISEIPEKLIKLPKIAENLDSVLFS